jgi:radical SAM superfamily enzyme YgiQ (UPF0313 family)
MRILLLNPGTESSGMPHYGLAMLGTLLKMTGHQARVADYQCSPNVPVEAILLTFRPHVVGVCIFSALRGEADEIVDVVRRWDPKVPIVCGGPHASCYAEELAQDERIDYVVVGEAETAIVDLVERASRQDHPLIIHPDLPDVNKLPLPDYRIFYAFRSIRFYPLVSSRGCPHQCSFCAVHVTNSGKWRAREVASCLKELSSIRQQLPNVRQVVIWDDNFSLDLERGKQLIRGYLASDLAYPLRPANMRADRVDYELVQLLKMAGCQEIQIGAEHGDPQVFSTIGKGETLEDIRRAGRIVKSHRMRLVLSFVIGLPGDSVRKTLASARLARELKADHCYWNILVPYKGTRVYEYFVREGHVNGSHVPKTWAPMGSEEWPCADTPGFEASERIEARRVAEIFSEQVALRGHMGFACRSAIRRGFVGELLLLLTAKLMKGSRRQKQGEKGRAVMRCSRGGKHG